MDNILNLKKIEKSFGNKVILDQFNLDIKKGESIAIIGKSGSGKSTLLNIISLIEPIDAGQIIFDNKDISSIKYSKKIDFLRDNIGFLFQNYALIENESVIKNVEIGLKYRKDLTNKEAKKNEVKRLLDLVGLAGFEDRLIYTLSGGEQQRIALARLIGKPSKIILADEPTGNLDNANSEIIMEILLKEKYKGKAIIVVTHNENHLELFDRVIKLS